MLCERLDGRTRILLKEDRKFHNLPVLSKGLLIVYIKKKYINKS